MTPSAEAGSSVDQSHAVVQLSAKSVLVLMEHHTAHLQVLLPPDDCSYRQESYRCKSLPVPASRLCWLRSEPVNTDIEYISGVYSDLIRTVVLWPRWLAPCVFRPLGKHCPVL